MVKHALHSYPMAEKLSAFEEPRRFNDEDDFKSLLFEAIKHKCSDVFIQPNTPALALIHGEIRALTYRLMDSSDILQMVEWASGRATAKTDLVQGIPVDSRYEVFSREDERNNRNELMRYGFRVNG